MTTAGMEASAPAWGTGNSVERLAPRSEVFDRHPMRLARLARRLGLLLMALGVIWRLGRYLLRFPIWGDEAMLCLNFLDRDFLGLTRQLDGSQVAPLLFLWTETAILRLLGGAEWALRLVPFLLGIASLGIFWQLARLTLKPLPAAFAIGLLAAARWPVSMACFVKPYSGDLFFSLALIVPAVQWLKQPERLGWLVLLTALTPLAVGSSYPAVFVAGGVILALTWPGWKGGRASRLMVSLLAVVTVASFLAHYLLVGHERAAPNAGDVVTAMQDYWADGFPPRDPLALVRWLILTQTGRMMAYPVGDANGGSAATFILFALGVVTWWRAGRRSLLLLMLAPFGLNFVAACMHKYPYGACCRLSQHLAPAICLLAASGLAFLVERLTQTQALRKQAVCWICGALALVGLGGLAVDLHFPYRDKEAVWNDSIAREVMARARPEDAVVVLNPRDEAWAEMRWHLELLGARVGWAGQVNWERLRQTGGRLWCLDLWTDHGPEPRGTTATLSEAPEHWGVAARVPYTIRPRTPDAPTHHVDLYLCTLESERRKAAKTQLISCFP